VNLYNYNIDLPFCNKKISFREITTNEQIAIAKAVLSFPNKKDSYLEFNNFFLDILLNCVKEKEDFKQINIIDYVLFVTKLRIISIGETIQLVTESDNPNAKSSKITLDLNEFLKNIYLNGQKLLTDNLIKYKDIEIKISWPHLNSIKLFQNLILKNENNSSLFLDSYQEFIEYIKIKDNKINLYNFSSEEKIQILDKLSLSFVTKIQEKILNLIKEFSDFNYWGISKFEDYKFNFYSLSFIDFIKLFFSYDIKSIYYEICFLASNGLDANYISNLSHMDRKVFVNTVIQQIQEKNKPSNSDSSQGMIPTSSQAVQDLALEFGDVAP